MKLGKSLGVQIPFGSNSNSPIGRALQTLYTPDKIDYTAYGCLIQHCTDQHLVLPAKQLHARLFLFSVTSDNFLASKLVSFYSKTNHLCGARYVFDKIPRKNVFSWNAMLIGYSHQSMHHEALQFFSSLAFSNDIDHDRYNITCVLKAMSSLFSDSQSAKVVHCFILRRGLDLDIFVLNALITYYSRCEELGLARAVFDRMPQRDLVPWNAMIAGYSQSGFYVDCKQLYKHMLDVRGPRPNGVTLVSVLQAYGQSKDLILGMVHRLITDRGIQMDTSICNTLIALYAKCGSLDYSLELFEGMNEKDEFTYGSLVSGYMAYGFVGKAMDVFRELKMPALSTWNAVISGLCQNKQLEQAIDLVREMQARGFRVNTVTISSILPIFSQLSYLREAKSIHAYAVKHSYNRNIYVATAIIDTYAKLGFIHGAKCVFDQAEGRSLVKWTSIITAYGGHGDANVAQSLLYKMIEDGIQPDGVNDVVVSPVQVCLFITKKRLSSLQFLQQQVSPSRHLSSQTQKRRIESTRFATALRVLDVIKPKKPTSYEKPQAQTQAHLRLIEDILQTTTTDDQIPDDVLQSSDPETDGVAIDSSVLSYAVSSCGSKRDLLGGRQYHCLALTSGFVANVYVGSSLISLYSRCAMLEDAYGVFEEMPVRNVVSWTAIIAGYAQECQIHACSMLFHRMRSSELQPNDFTFTSLLSACTGSGAIGHGRSLHAQIIHLGYHSYVRILNALITVYYKCGTLQDALYIFRNMDGKDIVSWNSMIAGYAQHGHAIEAINLFEKMKRQHIKPDAFTYLGVLSSCRHAGLVEEGKGYFNSMVEHGVKAELDHYSCVVDLLGRAGLLSEALEFIRSMPVCPNAVIWGSLLSSCQLHGSVWIGIQAAESKMLLEPECPATILQLANLYASVGWWDKAASVRRMMKERGMKTNPGNSWIEIRNRVFRFGVDDGSNTRIFCILKLMDCLKDHMRSSRSEFELLDEDVEMLSSQ